MYNCNNGANLDLNDLSQSSSVFGAENARYLPRSRSLIDSIAANLGLEQHNGLSMDARINPVRFESKSLLKSNPSSIGCTLNACDDHEHCEPKKRPRSTFPFGKCKVCSDKATGVHYGIATCEGCKVKRVITFHLIFIQYILNYVIFFNGFFRDSLSEAFCETSIIDAFSEITV